MTPQASMMQLWLGSAVAPLCFWDAPAEAWLPVESWQVLMASYHGAAKPAACLYVPSQSVMVVQHDIDARHIKKLGEDGLKYLFENISLSPTDTLVVRYAAADAAGSKHTFYAMTSQDLQLWQDAASLYVDVVAILPDFLLLPAAPCATTDMGRQRCVSICLHAANPLLRMTEQGMDVGMSVPSVALLKSLLHTWQNDNDALTITPIAQHGEMIDGMDAQLVAMLCADEGCVDVTAAMPLGCVAMPVRHSLNFLESQSARMPTFSPLIALALGCVIIKLIIDGLNYYYYHQANVRLDDEIRQQLRLWLPEQTINTRNNLQAQLAPFLPSQYEKDGNLDAILASLRAANVEVVRLHLQRTDVGHHIEVALTAQDSAHIDALIATLGQIGAQATLKQMDGALRDDVGQVASAAILEIQSPAH